MLLITTTHRPATDLGFLLHKNPDRLQRFEQSFGSAVVFYPEATDEKCTMALLLEVDPVALVRGKGRGDGTLDQYVNDRPYAATSYLSVALGQIFRTAIVGTCKERPELAQSPIPIEIQIPVLPSPSDGLVERLFEPLGYEVVCRRLPLDEQFPDWGESRYCDVTLKANLPLSVALSHLYVLIPTLDAQKHYFIDKVEVDKLLRKGAGWLDSHPAIEEIVSRYLRRDRALVRMALDRLAPDVEPLDEVETEPVEKKASLHDHRHEVVLQVVEELGAKSVLDLGCSDGKLLVQLFRKKGLQKIVGLDVSFISLERAARRLRLDGLSPKARERIDLLHGSLTYRDKRLSGFDAALVVEVIEHLDPSRLAAFERVLFEFARPVAVVLTTPNQEYNALFPGMEEGQMRHGDHRFEWTRKEFETWTAGVAEKFGYSVEVRPVGPLDPVHGAPSQMAVFRR